MIRINEQGKIELLVDPKPPTRFQLRMDPGFYGVWKLFKELGPARSMTNEQLFQGMISVIIADHPWLETLAEVHQEEIRGKAEVFKGWWEMSGGLPSDLPGKFGSSNQVGAPIRPSRQLPPRSSEPTEEWQLSFEADTQASIARLEAKEAAEAAAAAERERNADRTS